MATNDDTRCQACEARPATEVVELAPDEVYHLCDVCAAPAIACRKLAVAFNAFTQAFNQALARDLEVMLRVQRVRAQRTEKNEED